MSNEALSREDLEARNKAQKQSYWALVWVQLKKNRPGMVGLWIIFFIVFVAIFAPLIANDRPIVASYKGNIEFPAFTSYVDSWVPWQDMRNDLKSMKVGESYPFGDYYAALDGQSWKEARENEPDAFGFSLWPLVEWNPNQIHKGFEKSHPSTETMHLLGTDDGGRDVLARIIHGSVVAVTVGVVAMGLAASIGIFLGVIAGYFGGKTDLALSRFTEIVMTFPAFFLIIAVISFLPPSTMNIMVVIGITRWTGIFRLIRGEVLRCKDLDYVMAARALGVPTRLIMFKQILPNAISPVFVSIAFGVASAVLTETSLSFLGFGDTSVPSWGEIVSQGREYVKQNLTYLILAPGFAIFMTLTAFNLFGQGLRDAMDPRLRR